jgi:hypothetical protein
LIFLVFYIHFTLENPSLLPKDYVANPIRDIVPVDTATLSKTRSRSPSPTKLTSTSSVNQGNDPMTGTVSDSEEHLDDRSSAVTTVIPSVPPKKREKEIPKEVSQEPTQDSQVIFLLINSYIYLFISLWKQDKLWRYVCHVQNLFIKIYISAQNVKEIFMVDLLQKDVEVGLGMMYPFDTVRCVH